MSRFPSFGMRLTVYVVALQFLTLAGCATQVPPTVTLSMRPDVRRIALLEPAPVERFESAAITETVADLGFLGGLIASGNMAVNSKALAGAMEGRAFSPHASMRDALVRELTSAGYQVATIPVRRQGRNLLSDYRGLPTTFDAFLDMIITVGYFPAAGRTDYIPMVRVHARIVDAASTKVLFEDRFAYGYMATGYRGQHLPASERYRFADFPSLKANVPLAIEGLEAGVPLIAVRIVRNLTR